jgi:hypothetical protein
MPLFAPLDGAAPHELEKLMLFDRKLLDSRKSTAAQQKNDRGPGRFGIGDHRSNPPHTSDDYKEDEQDEDRAR